MIPTDEVVQCLVMDHPRQVSVVAKATHVVRHHLERPDELTHHLRADEVCLRLAMVFKHRQERDP